MAASIYMPSVFLKREKTRWEEIEDKRSPGMTGSALWMGDSQMQFKHPTQELQYPLKHLRFHPTSPPMTIYGCLRKNKGRAEASVTKGDLKTYSLNPQG